ncbi:MAG: hypothetical protein AAGH67_00865 [Cyanobacteria bacterium P01_H01_bin.162]
MLQDSRSLDAPPPAKAKSFPYWRWLLPPMLLASIGLHGLVLFAPVGPSEDDLLPPPDPEEDGIAITKIEAPQPRQPVAAPTNPGTVKTAPARSSAAAATPATPARSASSTQSNTGQRQSPAAPSQSSGRSPRSGQPTVPDLSTVDSVQNPNPDTPAVEVPVADTPTDPFEEYIEVFGSYNGVTVTADADQERSSWLGSFSDRGAAFTDLEIQPLASLDSVPYAANICLPSAPTTAEVLVLVDADGELDNYQPFLQQTGYRHFNDAAKALIAAHDFPEAAGPQAYLAEVAVDYDTDDCEWPPEVDRIPSDYFTVLEAYVGPELTTPREAATAQVDWLKVLQEADNLELPEGELEATELADFEPEVEYALAICLPLPPRDAKWGVVVQPDGSLSGEPHPLRSTGYDSFNDRALELVKNYDFPEADAPQIYVVTVPVDYNATNCTTLETFEAAEPTPPEADSDSEDAADTSATTTDEPPVEALAFSPDQQTELIDRGRRNVVDDMTGALNDQPGIAADFLAGNWPPDIDQSCFLSELDPDAGVVPAEAAADALIVTLNANDAPPRLSQFYGTEVEDAGEYCDALLVQMSLEGVPQLFASIIGFGDGDANTLAVIWRADPRNE